MKENIVVVLDLETTGLSPYRHKITEIAAVKIKNGVVIDEFSSLINPQEPIPAFITRLTGISDELVKDSPTIEEVLPALKNFLSDHTIVAHNASFDFNFLKFNFLSCLKHELNNPVLCTVKLANRVHSDLPSKKLSSLCEFYGLTNDNAHRAMSDVLVTKDIFLNMVNKLSKKGLSSLKDIKHFESLPRYKAVSLFLDE